MDTVEPVGVAVTEVLVSWGIPLEVINNFTANGISVEHFPHLTPECLKELCPHLATRLVLQERISELITAQAPTETNSNSTCCTPSNNTLLISLDDIEVTSLLESPKTVNIESPKTVNIHTRKTFPQFDLETLLQTSPGGTSILKYYETYGSLDTSKRNQLTDLIIKHIYTYIVNCRITYEEYNVLAAKIITLFPKESVGTYFTKPLKKIESINGRSTVARGKLVDKVRNLLYKYGDRKRGSVSGSENTPPPKKKNCDDDDLQELHSRDILWLNNNSEPWEEVIIKWKATYNLRKEGEQKNMHEFLRDWKILSDPRSEILINIDFDLLYPEKGLNFYINWDTFYEKLIGLKKTQDERITNLIDSLKNIEGELKLPTQLKILAKLVPPKGRLSKKVKFTTEEAIESLFICIPNAGDIEQTITSQKEKASAKKLSIQPYIILQGSLSECASPLLIIDDVKYQFQSIRKSFDTQNLIDESNASDGDVIRNVIQGSLWRELIANMDKDSIVIPLILYFDDFESGNALGSHAGAYKLGAVYVSIATIPPEKSSRLENIFVTQLFYSNDRLLFGNSAIFNKIIEELKFLEEVGINVVWTKKNVTVKFVLVTLSGDNLGLHGILGYFESFMATNFCRFCLTTKTDSETQTCELNNLRQPVDYETHLENRIGIKEQCVWNNLEKFHVYINITCDVMHDLMEGVLRYGMALVVQNLINKQYFSLDRLNSRIKYFKFNTSEKNLPPPINRQHLLNKSLTMSASEMLCLTRNFVFIVGDLVEENDPVWDYYLLLLEITNVLTSQAFTSDLIDYLKGIIEEHHKLYLNLFQSRLKPKHHFLSHYPTVIKKIGPPILISAFKYEAKHKELKKVCQSITSRIDLPLSVMKRCQLKQSFRYATDKGLTENLRYGKFDFDNDNLNGKDCFYVDWCELNGIRYNVNNVVLQDVNDDIPKYCIINKIVLNQNNNDILFECFVLDIVTYSAHLRAYKVVQSKRKCTILYGDLYTNLISVLYKVNLESYVKVDF